jgi:hypothetical protein
LPQLVGKLKNHSSSRLPGNTGLRLMIDIDYVFCFNNLIYPIPAKHIPM